MCNQSLVGILSTIDAPLLPMLLKKLYESGLKNLCVIADAKTFSEKDRLIWKERTNGLLDPLGVGIYDFAISATPFYFVNSHTGEDCLTLLEKLSPMLLINGGTPRKLTTKVIERSALGVINVHPGVLPKYRGSCCVEWAILNDEPIGVTAHFITEGYDEGPIIDTELCKLSVDDDYVAIRVKVYLQSISLLARTVLKVLNLRLTCRDAIPQSAGIFFKPISKDQMQEVIHKIRSRTYLFLR